MRLKALKYTQIKDLMNGKHGLANNKNFRLPSSALHLFGLVFFHVKQWPHHVQKTFQFVTDMAAEWQVGDPAQENRRAKTCKTDPQRFAMDVHLPLKLDFLERSPRTVHRRGRNSTMARTRNGSDSSVVLRLR